MPSDHISVNTNSELILNPHHQQASLKTRLPDNLIKTLRVKLKSNLQT